MWVTPCDGDQACLLLTCLNTRAMSSPVISPLSENLQSAMERFPRFCRVNPPSLFSEISQLLMVTTGIYDAFVSCCITCTALAWEIAVAKFPENLVAMKCAVYWLDTFVAANSSPSAVPLSPALALAYLLHNLYLLDTHKGPCEVLCNSLTQPQDCVHHVQRLCMGSV